MEAIINGLKLRDKPTGFVGIVTVVAHYHGAKTRACLERMTDDNRVLEYWFDADRLEPVPQDLDPSTASSGSDARPVRVE